MKLIHDMTHEEIISLGVEDLERMVLYRCAQDGVKIPGKTPIAPVRPTVEPDVKVYAVDEIYLSDAAMAQELADFFSRNTGLLRSVECNWNVGSDYKYAKHVDGYKIERLTSVKTTSVLSEAKFGSFQATIVAFGQAQKKYEEDLKEYKAAVAGSSNIRDDIFDAFSHAMERQRSLESAKAAYAQYLDLADGDIETAKKFFNKAHTVDSWVGSVLFPVENTVSNT